MKPDLLAEREALEQALGYRFQNPKLLKTALTHTSYVKGENRQAHGSHNERLEFLGDAVLELVVSQHLFLTHEDRQEGELTRMRANLVRESALFQAAKALGIPQAILLGPGEERTGGREKPSIVSDALEAVIGALYLDGGFEAALPLVMEHVIRPLAEQAMESDRKDYKTQLQELVQKRRLGAIQYELTGAEGPEHQRIFHMEVLIAGIPMGSGSGSSKQAAGQSAAQAALKTLTETPQENTEEICD